MPKRIYGDHVLTASEKWKRWANKQEKEYCELCDKYFTAYKIKRHIETKAHKAKEFDKINQNK